MRSLDKLKPLYFLCRSAYGHQTWQDGNLSWWAPTHKVTKTINTWSCKVSWQSKTIISPLPQLLWLPKLGRLVIYFEELLSIYWHDLLFTWSCEIPWQTKNIISPLPQYLLSANLARCWQTMRSSHSKSYMILQSRGFVRSRDKLNTIWQDCGLPWGHSTDKFT